MLVLVMEDRCNRGREVEYQEIIAKVDLKMDLVQDQVDEQVVCCRIFHSRLMI